MGPYSKYMIMSPLCRMGSASCNGVLHTLGQRFCVPEIRLLQHQAEALKQNLSQVPLRGYQQDPSKREGPGPVCSRSVATFEHMSFQALRRAGINPVLDSCARHLNSGGAFLIRGIDYGDIPPTSAARAMHTSPIPEALVAGITQVLGCKLVGYEDQLKLNTHLLFHDIRPVKGGREGANGGGGLGMHMDMGFRPDIRPNFLILACLREGIDKRVLTPLVDSKSLYRSLLERFPEDEKVLRDPGSYDIRSPETSGSYKVDTPLLTGCGENVAVHLRLDRMRPLNEDARRALDHVQQLVHENEHGIHFEGGDLLVVNNHRVLHRRSKVQSSYDGRDRFLIRAYAKDSAFVPHSRIYPMFERPEH